MSSAIAERVQAAITNDGMLTTRALANSGVTTANKSDANGKFVELHEAGKETTGEPLRLKRNGSNVDLMAGFPLDTSVGSVKFKDLAKGLQDNIT